MLPIRATGIETATCVEVASRVTLASLRRSIVFLESRMKRAPLCHVIRCGWKKRIVSRRLS